VQWQGKGVHVDEGQTLSGMQNNMRHFINEQCMMCHQRCSYGAA
jgi:hypothetical protein